MVEDLSSRRLNPRRLSGNPTLETLNQPNRSLNYGGGALILPVLELDETSYVFLPLHGIFNVNNLKW